jgi:acyl-CoA synthetase (AMP-forming)/AMP-acid ligase II
VILESPYPRVELPRVTIHDHLFAAFRAAPDAVAMTAAASGETVTKGQLLDRSLRFAAGLRGLGFHAGDTLAIIAPNCLDYPVAFLGVSVLGGCSALPNPLGTMDEFTGQLQRTGTSVVVTIPALLDRVLPAAAVAGVNTVVVIGEAPAGTVPFASLVESEPLTTLPGVDPTRVVALPFSSGTSGRPKAVKLTHLNLIANMHQFAIGMPQADGQRIIAVLPFFHIYGLVLIMLASLWRDRPLVVMPRFDLEAFLETIARYRIQLAPVVPPIMVALAKHPLIDKYDLSSLRYLMTGAAPLGADVERAVAARLGALVVQGYGMTEVCGASQLQQLDPATVRSGTVGQLVVNMQARVVDPVTGLDVGTGERGELWMRGPNVTSGYLDDADATARTITPDGWLKSGDIAVVDANGFYAVVDRLKELIKYKAHQVAPADLEAVLLTHPLIADAAVIPSPDAEAGEIPKAFVVARGALTADDVMDFVASKVSPMDKVRRVEFIDAIPKSPSGKILRRVLVDRERATQGNP